METRWKTRTSFKGLERNPSQFQKASFFFLVICDGEADSRWTLASFRKQEENSLGAVEAANESQSKSASSNSKSSKGGKGKGKQVKQVVQEVMVLSSSQPHLTEESEQEDEEELLIPKKKRKTTSENEKGKKREKKSKYDRLAEKNLGVSQSLRLHTFLS